MFITMTMPHTTFRPWRRWRPWLSVVPLCVSIHAVAQRPSRSSLRVEKVRGSGRSVLLGWSQTFANSFGRWCIVSLCYAIYVWICAQLWKMILLMFSCTATSHSLIHFSVQTFPVADSQISSKVGSTNSPIGGSLFLKILRAGGIRFTEPSQHVLTLWTRWTHAAAIGDLDHLGFSMSFSGFRGMSWSRISISWQFPVGPHRGLLKINETCWSEPVHLSSNMPWVLGRTKMNQVKRGSKLWNSPCSNMFITQVNHAGWSENGAYRKIP